MLIDSGDGSNSSSSSSGGSSGEDIGKLTRKRLNRGLPGRKQGTVRNQVVPAPTLLGAPQERVAVQAPVTMSPDPYHKYQSRLPSGSDCCTH